MSGLEQFVAHAKDRLQFVQFRKLVHGFAVTKLPATVRTPPSPET